MCKIAIDKTLNPNFVLYNLVFGSNPLRCIDADSLDACMQVYGVDIDRSQIQSRLSDWYSSGMLRVRDGVYVVA